MYVGIRYGAAYVFKRLTVHRGMFHSIPAMLIAGLVTFLRLPPPADSAAPPVGGAVMIGFLSHLLLDELCSVDFRGLKPKLNQFAGKCLKFSVQVHARRHGDASLLLVALEMKRGPAPPTRQRFADGTNMPSVPVTGQFPPPVEMTYSVLNGRTSPCSPDPLLCRRGPCGRSTFHCQH